MKMGAVKRKIVTKIAFATAIAIFSLGAAFSGTYAWFVAQLDRSTTVSQFQVASLDGCSLKTVNLIKFDYHEDAPGHFDYADPQDGGIHRYGFNKDEQKFGTGSGNNFKAVDNMNMYDPVEHFSEGNNYRLIDRHCNALYEVVFSAKQAGNYSVNTFANLDTDKDTDDGIPLSDCADFDVFSPSDITQELANDSTAHTYADYKAVFTLANCSSETDKNIYCSLSWQSHLLNSHSHFYKQSGQKDQKIALASNQVVSFVQENDDFVGRIYINVNYAPNQLTEYVESNFTSDIMAIYDFYFNFQFDSGGGN